MRYLWRLLRRVLGPVVTVVTGILGLLLGWPPDVISVAGMGVSQFVGSLLPSEQSRQAVADDRAHLERRAAACEQFGASVVVVWLSAGQMMTYGGPRLVGYVHGLLHFMRAQRRLEDGVAAAAAALSNVLLYGSADTQTAAIEVFTTLGEKLGELGRCKQGSIQAKRVHERASGELGDRVVAWRNAAQADLAGSK